MSASLVGSEMCIRDRYSWMRPWLRRGSFQVWPQLAPAHGSWRGSWACQVPPPANADRAPGVG
eukprot:13995899-Alexandrium_andersonii.AAC.1